MNRRELMKFLAAGGVVVAGELWMPGRKLISIPNPLRPRLVVDVGPGNTLTLMTPAKIGYGALDLMGEADDSGIVDIALPNKMVKAILTEPVDWGTLRPQFYGMPTPPNFDQTSAA